MLTLWKDSYDQLSILKCRDITSPTNLSSQGYDFSSGYIWMWVLDYKERWDQKNWCFWTELLEKPFQTQWTWVWVDSRSGWWTGRLGTLRSMWSQRVGHDWANEINWTESIYGYESSTIEKAECQRTETLELSCWRRWLRAFGQQGDQPSQS